MVATPTAIDTAIKRTPNARLVTSISESFSTTDMRFKAIIYECLHAERMPEDRDITVKITS